MVEDQGGKRWKTKSSSKSSIESSVRNTRKTGVTPDGNSWEKSHTSGNIPASRLPPPASRLQLPTRSLLMRRRRPAWRSRLFWSWLLVVLSLKNVLYWFLVFPAGDSSYFFQIQFSLALLHQSILSFF